MNEFRPSKKKWHTLKDNKVYETPIFDLVRKTVSPGTDKDAGVYYVLDAPEWINVLPITPENKIILVEQYRHGVNEVTLEIPGGMVDPGEQPLEAAKRELLEETGYTSEEWDSLGKASSNPAIMTNFTHLFLAKNCMPEAEPETGQFEDITVHMIPLEEFWDWVRRGTIHHSIVLAAVAKYLVINRR